MATLLVAIGNPLRGDDGVAWRLGDMMPSGWTAECTIQLTPEWASAINGFERVVFADASVECALPELRLIVSAGDGGAFSHHVTPVVVTALARSLFGFKGEAWTLHIPAFAFEAADSLSAECARALEKAGELLHLMETQRRDNQTAATMSNPSAPNAAP